MTECICLRIMYFSNAIKRVNGPTLACRMHLGRHMSHRGPVSHRHSGRDLVGTHFQPIAMNLHRLQHYQAEQL